MSTLKEWLNLKPESIECSQIYSALRDWNIDRSLLEKQAHKMETALKLISDSDCYYPHKIAQEVLK